MSVKELLKKYTPKKYGAVALVILVGAALMLWPTGGKNSGETEETGSTGAVAYTFDLEALEKKLEEVLGNIEGAGEVSVVLTLKNSGEQVLATDEISDSDSIQSQTVIVERGSSAEETVAIQNIYPEFQGALIVCDGGGSDRVKLRIISAVSALTGLDSTQISVSPRG